MPDSGVWSAMTAEVGPTRQWFAGSWAAGWWGQLVQGQPPASALALGTSGWTMSGAGVRRGPCGIAPTAPGDATTTPIRRTLVWSARSGTPPLPLDTWGGLAGQDQATVILLPLQDARVLQLYPQMVPSTNSHCVPLRSIPPVSVPRQPPAPCTIPHRKPWVAVGGSCPSPLSPSPVT